MDIEVLVPHTIPTLGLASALSIWFRAVFFQEGATRILLLDTLMQRFVPHAVRR